jgi:hypothetical protein
MRGTTGEAGTSGLKSSLTGAVPRLRHLRRDLAPRYVEEAPPSAGTEPGSYGMFASVAIGWAAADGEPVIRGPSCARLRCVAACREAAQVHELLARSG